MLIAQRETLDYSGLPQDSHSGCSSLDWGGQRGRCPMLSLSRTPLPTTTNMSMVMSVVTSHAVICTIVEKKLLFREEQRVFL